MEIEIREANLCDINAIVRINKDELGYKYPEDKTKLILKQCIESVFDKVFVAVYDKQVIGYAHAHHYQVLYAGAMKDIMGIAVDHQYRRCGAATKLMDEIVHWAKKDGCDGVRLVSGNSRKGAHTFYKQYGFKDSKQQTNFKFMF